MVKIVDYREGSWIELIVEKCGEWSEPFFETLS